MLQASQTAEALTTTQSRLSSVQEDLRIASDIQQRMLVSKDKLESLSPWLDCYAYMVPCRDIGGDFYDLIRLDADHVAIVVGDVSGKGIPAAMMMATCITLLRAYTESFRSASRIMRKVNPRLIDGNEDDCMFTTLFLGIMNCHRNTFTYCNAGHNPAILQRSDGSILRLDDIHGPAVGVMHNVEYEETRVPIHAGDRLLLYTDGASETFSDKGELYGDERLATLCAKSSNEQPSQKLLSQLLRDLKRFRGTEQPHDDVTVVCVKRLANPESDLATMQVDCAADAAGMASLMQQADGFCEQQSINPEISGRLQLVLDELLMNVVSYGSEGAAAIARINLSLRLQSDLLVVEIRDTGKPFNPFALAEPDTDLTIEERELGGLGVFMVRSLTQSFSYNYEEPYNFVRLEIDCANGAPLP
jgi:sigma-B regulation protein RsbU (phosphoserine phosphatase)